MGTMEGWGTRKANEAAERAGRDEAMKIIGAKEERARIRRELLDAITAWRRTAFQGAGEGERHIGANVAIGVTLAVLDRIIPEER